MKTEIKEEDLINIIAKWKNDREFDINVGIDYYKFLEKYKNIVEIKTENTLKCKE